MYNKNNVEANTIYIYRERKWFHILARQIVFQGHWNTNPRQFSWNVIILHFKIQMQCDLIIKYQSCDFSQCFMAKCLAMQPMTILIVCTRNDMNFKHSINTFRWKQNGRRFADDIFKFIFWLWLCFDLNITELGSYEQSSVGVNNGLAPNRRPGRRLDIKMLSYQYREPHVKDKMVSRPSYL